MTPPSKTPTAGAPPSRKSKSVGPAVVVGTALEFFDFYLYASMAALVFGPIFFPSENSAVSTLAAFSTFAVGFLVRPLGGIVFGILGDRIGRKAVLTCTLLLMGVATGCIGLIPSYEKIGIAAPILLVVFRLLQGFGAGAEFGSAVAMSYEHAASKSRGRQGAWPALGVNIGLLASSLAVTAVTSLSDDASTAGDGGSRSWSASSSSAWATGCAGACPRPPSSSRWPLRPRPGRRRSRSAIC